MLNCTFCSELQGIERYDLFQNTLKEEGIDRAQFPSRIVYRDRDFTVLPMVGPMVEGYLLIIPTRHSMSFAHLDESLYPKLHRLKEIVSAVLTQKYQTPVFFEHGAMSATMRAGCCSDHAHIHAVPIAVDVKDDFHQMGFEPRELSSLSELKLQHNRQMSYLYYENQEGKAIVMDAPVAPSQFIRQRIAAKLDWGDRWDWRRYKNVEMMRATVETLRPVFDQLKEI